MLKQQREQQLAIQRNDDADNRSPSSVPLLTVTGLYIIYIFIYIIHISSHFMHAPKHNDNNNNNKTKKKF